MKSFLNLVVLTELVLPKKKIVQAWKTFELRSSLLEEFFDVKKIVKTNQIKRTVQSPSVKSLYSY